ncbi:MAG TPA: hypothetical protein VFZ65_19255 [Planctomycetota bacterium]|nr:hypothetical protein [Planctomycetota bacterium]
MILTVIANAGFLADLKTGVLIGVGLVVFILYPAYLCNHERRLALLERPDRLRDMPTAQQSNSTQEPADRATAQAPDQAAPHARPAAERD